MVAQSANRTTALLPSDAFLSCWNLLFWGGGVSVFWRWCFFLMRGCKCSCRDRRVKSRKEGRMSAEGDRRPQGEPRTSARGTRRFHSGIFTPFQSRGNFSIITKQGSSRPSPAPATASQHQTWSLHPGLGAEWSRGSTWGTPERVRSQRVNAGHRSQLPSLHQNIGATLHQRERGQGAAEHTYPTFQSPVWGEWQVLGSLGGTGREAGPGEEAVPWAVAPSPLRVQGSLGSSFGM